MVIHHRLATISLLLLIYTFVLQSTNASKAEPSNRPDQIRPNSAFNLPVNSPEMNLTKHIIVATLESAPFMMKRRSAERNGSVEWYGYCIDLLDELIKHLPYQMTYEIYQVADNKYGSKEYQIVRDISNDTKLPIYKKVGRWNGLIGDLQQSKAQLALAPLAVMAERELAIDFTVPFYDLVGIQILLKKPEVPQDWFKFLTVLDKEVWFSITVAYFVTSFIMFLFDRLSPYSHKNSSRIKKLNEERQRAQAMAVDKSSLGKSHLTSNISGNLRLLDPMPGIFKSHADVDLKQKREENQSKLFIGSLSNSIGMVRRQSNLLLSNFESIIGRRRSSVLPSSEINTKPNGWQNPRGSYTLSDYLQSIEIRKNINGVGVDDAESSDEDNGKPVFGLKDSLWFCITSLTPQGGGEAPQNLSGRVVAGAWWLFCFIIIASYTANLAAFLTVSRLDIPIESLDDLVKQYRIKYAPVDGTAEQTYFERMAYIEEIFYNIWKDMSLNASLSEEERSKFAVWDYPISDKYTKIWAQIQQTGMPADMESGIKRVKRSSLDDGFALLADANMVKHAVMTDCSFKAVGEEFSRKPIALGVRKGDDKFRDDLSFAILQLINQRFMEILREKWWINNPNRVLCDNNDESEGISIENIGGVFIIIFAGVLLSFLVWAIERFVYKTKIEVSRELIKSS